MELISPANNDSVIEVQRAEDQEIQQRTKIMFESSVLPLSRGGKAEKIQKRGGSRRFRKCFRRNSSGSNGDGVEMKNTSTCTENDSAKQTDANKCHSLAPNDEPASSDDVCCSCLSRKISPIFGCLANIFVTISIIGLLKSMFSFAMFLYDIISDIIVGKEQLDDGEPWWGFWIIFLTFLPNIVFAFWFAVAHMGELGRCETWSKLFFAGMVQIVTMMNLIFGILLAFKPKGIEVGGVFFNADSTTGNCNFFRTVEGFMEALPQSTYQLSIMIRTDWDLINSNQMISVVMSVITLSMTASTYLFYHHRGYIHYDEKVNRRYRGVNDPPLISTLLCTVFYLILTPPRIWANALVLSITPLLTPVMLGVEFLFNLAISHKYALDLRKNKVFPSGIITAVFNFLCPCTPADNLGKINLFSTLLIVLKVILLYPIVYFNILEVEYDNRPDQFRCWNETHFENSTSFNATYNSQKNVNTTITLPRACRVNETPNQLLFEYVLPFTITSLLVLSIPAGFLISKYTTPQKLTAINNSIATIVDKVKNLVVNLMKCSCCRKSKESSVINNEQNNEITCSVLLECDQSSLERGTEKSEDIELNEINDTTNQDAIKTPEEEVRKLATPGNSTGCVSSMMTFLNNVRAMFDTMEEKNENCTRIAIGGGNDATSYVLNIVSQPSTNVISVVSYNKLPNVPNAFYDGFSCLCEGRSILGGGKDNSGNKLKNVYELDMDEYHPLSLLNEARFSLGSCYLDEYLIVSGGWSSYSSLDTIEMLEITAAQNGSEWTKSNSRLPYHVYGHTLSSLNGKVILIGGRVSGPSNKVWEGTPDFKKNNIEWKEMPSMQTERSGHFSVVVNSNIIVMGGDNVREDKVEIWDGTKWITGPSVPSDLDTEVAQAVLNRNNQVIITSNDGLIIFDPENRTFKKYQEHKLREERRGYFAILQ